MAMLLAAVCAKGTSTINAGQIERGYERIDALGAKITRVPARAGSNIPSSSRP